jgi:hypothetical protein
VHSPSILFSWFQQHLLTHHLKDKIWICLHEVSMNPWWWLFLYRDILTSHIYRLYIYHWMDGYHITNTMEHSHSAGQICHIWTPLHMHVCVTYMCVLLCNCLIYYEQTTVFFIMTEDVCLGPVIWIRVLNPPYDKEVTACPDILWLITASVS